MVAEIRQQPRGTFFSILNRFGRSRRFLWETWPLWSRGSRSSVSGKGNLAARWIAFDYGAPVLREPARNKEAYSKVPLPTPLSHFYRFKFSRSRPRIVPSTSGGRENRCYKSLELSLTVRFFESLVLSDYRAVPHETVTVQTKLKGLKNLSLDREVSNLCRSNLPYISANGWRFIERKKRIVKLKW